MKKLINYLIALFCILCVSCTSPAQVVYSDGIVYDGITYYDYYMDNFYYGNTPVIYINGSYFLQYWDFTRNLWYRRPLPPEVIGSLRTNFWHNHELGGRWIGNYNDRFRVPRIPNSGRHGNWGMPQPRQRTIPMPGRDRPTNGGRAPGIGNQQRGSGFGTPSGRSNFGGARSGSTPSNRGGSSIGNSHSGGSRSGGGRGGR